MLTDLVNGLFELLGNKRTHSFDDGVKLPLQLTESQMQTVRNGFIGSIEKEGWVGAQIAKKKYFGVVQQLLASKDGYEAFCRWYKACRLFGLFQMGHTYLQVSQEILQATSVDVLLRYSDLVKDVDSLIGFLVAQITRLLVLCQKAPQK